MKRSGLALLLLLAIFSLPLPAFATPSPVDELCELSFAPDWRDRIPQHWRDAIQSRYEKDLDFYYKNHSFTPVSKVYEEEELKKYFGKTPRLSSWKKLIWGEKPIPTAMNAYHLAYLWAAGSRAQTEFLRLGYRHEKDIYGRSFFNSPQELFSIFENYRLTITEAENALVPALVFVRKEKNTSENPYYLSNDWENYRFVDPIHDGFPPNDDFDLLSYHQTTIPTPIWYRALAEGKVPFALANLLDHDVAHLTEFSANQALMSTTRAWYRRAYARPEIWDERSPGYARHEKLRRRAASVTEQFSLPNIDRADVMKDVFPSLFARSAPGVDLLESTKKDLEILSTHDLRQLVDRIANTQEALFIRMGGAMRDGYGFEMFNKPEEAAKTHLGLRQTNPKGPLSDPGRFGANADESLHGLLSEAQSILEHFSGEYPALIRKSLIDCIARIETALYMAVYLRLTPQQIVAESTQLEVSPNSATALYLNAFLREHSYLRHIFLDNGPYKVSGAQ